MLIKLKDDLTSKKNEFKKYSFDKKVNDLNTFQNNCVDLIRAANTKIKNNEGFKPVLICLLLSISVIGIPVVVISLTAKLTEGRFGLFGTEKSAHKPGLDDIYKNLKFGY